MSDSAGGVAARGGAVVLGGQAARFLVQAASLVVLARLLTPFDYGRFAEIMAVVGVASLLSDGGLSLAALQAGALTAQQRTNLFWANTVAGTVIGVVVALIAHPLADFYHDPGLVPLTQAVGVVFLLSGLQAQFRAQVNIDLRFSRMVRADVIGAVLGLLAAVVAAVAGAGAWALVVQQLTMVVVTLVLLIQSARWRPGLPRRAPGMRSLYTYGVNTLGVQLLNYLSVNVASVLLGRVAGPVQLGYYNRAYSLFTLPMLQLASPITRVALPIMSRDLRPDVLLRRLTRAQSLLSWVLVGIFLTLLGVSGPFLVVVFGARWSAAVPIFQILALGGVFQAIAYVYYWAFLITARTRTQLLIAAPARLLMIALVFPLSAYGATGVAASITIGLFVIWLANSTLGMRRLGLRARPLITAALRPCAVFGTIAVLQQVLALLTPALPSIAELGLGLLLEVVLLALALLLPPVRRDILAVVAAVRLALGRRGRRSTAVVGAA